MHTQPAAMLLVLAVSIAMMAVQAAYVGHLPKDCGSPQQPDGSWICQWRAFVSIELAWIVCSSLGRVLAGGWPLALNIALIHAALGPG